MVGAYRSRRASLLNGPHTRFGMHYVPVVASQEARRRAQMGVFRWGYWSKRIFYAYESTVIVPYWTVRGCGAEVLHRKLLFIGKTVQTIEIKWYRCRKFLMLVIITTSLERNVYSCRARIVSCGHVPTTSCVPRSFNASFIFRVHKPPVQAIFCTGTI